MALLLVIFTPPGAQVHCAVAKIIMVQYLSAICIDIESKVRNKRHSIVLPDHYPIVWMQTIRFAINYREEASFPLGCPIHICIGFPYLRQS